MKKPAPVQVEIAQPVENQPQQEETSPTTEATPEAVEKINKLY